MRELFLERIHYHLNRAQMHVTAGHPPGFAAGSFRKAAKWSARLNDSSLCLMLSYGLSLPALQTTF
jgi:hypothetical protein